MPQEKIIASSYSTTLIYLRRVHPMGTLRAILTYNTIRKSENFNNVFFLRPNDRKSQQRILYSKVFAFQFTETCHKCDLRIYIMCIPRYNLISQHDCVDFWHETVVVVPDSGMCKAIAPGVKQSRASQWRARACRSSRQCRYVSV